MAIATHIRCPSCQGGLVVSQMKCQRCQLVVSGEFASNEFASLGEEDLHFLRIFVHCEGRIRDMETALGVSYPSIKARLAKLKEALVPVAIREQVQTDQTAEVLRELEKGTISFAEAMEKIKGSRGKI